MFVGIISDTHDRLDTIRPALEYFTGLGITTLFHPGDVVAPFAARLLAGFGGKLHITYGNNDGERAGLKQILPQINDGPLFVELAGRRILLHHALDWCRPADLDRADVVITGHTHQAKVETRDGRSFVNPGECCGWVTGRCTVAVLDLLRREAEIIEVSPK